MLVEKIFKEFTIATPFYIMASPLKYIKVKLRGTHVLCLVTSSWASYERKQEIVSRYVNSAHKNPHGFTNS